MMAQPAPDPAGDYRTVIGDEVALLYDDRLRGHETQAAGWDGWGNTTEQLDDDSLPRWFACISGRLAARYPHGEARAAAQAALRELADDADPELDQEWAEELLDRWEPRNHLGQSMPRAREEARLRDQRNQEKTRQALTELVEYVLADDDETQGATVHQLPGTAPAAPKRRITVTKASEIRMRAVKWLWRDHLALGTLSLLAGREGLGKSTIAYWTAARITRGELDGGAHGDPRAVVVAATEDSWEHTIVPRLAAARADLDLIYRVEVLTSEDTHGSLVLPADNADLEAVISETRAALVLLDPLMSRIDGGLDTHKDGDVRRALEPIVSIADRTGAVVLGLIHLNKGTHSDLLTSVMGSRAFSAVARTVLATVPSPEDDQTRIFGVAKNNLGRDDLPGRTYRIAAQPMVDHDGEHFTTSRVEWLGESPTGVNEAARAGGEDPDARSATTEAAEWLADYMHMMGGRVASADVKEDGRKAGHSKDLSRARGRLKVRSESVGFPRRSYWISERDLPPVIATPGESAPTATTATTGQSGQQSSQSSQSSQTPRASATTETDVA